MQVTRETPVTVLITDFDNTLYNWFEMWYANFRTLLTGLVEKTGVSEKELAAEIRVVHQRHGTSEYSFIIEELPSVQRLSDGGDLVEEYEDVISAAVNARRAVTHLYPHVYETLLAIRERGTQIVTYTESQAFYSKRRMKWFKLDGLVDVLYTPPDHDIPDGVDLAEVRRYPPEYYQLAETEHRETPEGELKPNPELLLDIMGEVGGTPADTIYVGDSPVKDILMAQRAGVTDVHAEYGVVQGEEEYDLLRSVSHWTDKDVERERRVHNGLDEITPTHSINDFSDLLDLFEFGPFQV